MSMPRSGRVLAGCAGAAASLLLAVTAIAAQKADTTIGVSPRALTSAPSASPADFPGVRRIRRGVTLPRRWAVVSRSVQITRGDEAAYAAFRMTCPKGSTWRSGTSSGDIGAAVLDRTSRSHKRSVQVLATFPSSRIHRGDTARGRVFALCR